MRMVIEDYWNQYHINGKYVDNIVLYDDSGEVLDTEQTYISNQWGSAVKDIEEISEVSRRRVVNFDRKEHFTAPGRKGHTLYIYLGAFKSVRIEERRPAYQYPHETVYKKAVILEIGGEEYAITSRLEKYDHREPTPEAPMIEAVMNLYNSRVADHPNRHLTVSGANRLIEVLPELAEAVKRLKPKD